MAKRLMKPSIENVKIEYENTDIQPQYIEGAQGMLTQKGALHFTLYSEYIKQLEEVNAEATQIQSDSPADVAVNLSRKDPFGLDTSSITLIRRLEGSFVVTAPALRSIIDWLEKKHNEMIKAQSIQQ